MNVIYLLYEGGHGYLLGSGIAALSADYQWQTTAEGDYIVMLLQTARFLIKTVDGVRNGESLPGIADYLAPLKDKSSNLLKFAPPLAKSSKDFYNYDFLTSLYRQRALVAVADAHARLASRTQGGMTAGKAWNATSLCLTASARSHCQYFMLLKVYILFLFSFLKSKIFAITNFHPPCLVH